MLTICAIQRPSSSMSLEIFTHSYFHKHILMRLRCMGFFPSLGGAPFTRWYWRSYKRTQSSGLKSIVVGIRKPRQARYQNLQAIISGHHQAPLKKSASRRRRSRVSRGRGPGTVLTCRHSARALSISKKYFPRHADTSHGLTFEAHIQNVSANFDPLKGPRYMREFA